jgi:hypothetical protein
MVVRWLSCPASIPAFVTRIQRCTRRCQRRRGHLNSHVVLIGLSFTVLEPHIKSANLYLPKNSKMFVSPHNGPQAFVIAGLLDACADSSPVLDNPWAGGQDQNKIPYSWSFLCASWLSLHLPSVSMMGVSEKTRKRMLMWKNCGGCEDLAIPVFNAKNGEILLMMHSISI